MNMSDKVAYPIDIKQAFRATSVIQPTITKMKAYSALTLKIACIEVFNFQGR